jgi:hypothetical protein
VTSWWVRHGLDNRFGVVGFGLDVGFERSAVSTLRKGWVGLIWNGLENKKATRILY